jgi:hypothetical protein
MSDAKNFQMTSKALLSGTFSTIHKIFLFSAIPNRLTEELFQVLSEIEKSWLCEILDVPEAKKSGMPDTSTIEKLSRFLAKYQIDGYFAVCSTPVHSNFVFDEKGKVIDSTPTPSVFYTYYVYGEDIGQIVVKAATQARNLFLQDQADQLKSARI